MDCVVTSFLSVSINIITYQYSCYIENDNVGKKIHCTCCDDNIIEVKFNEILIHSAVYSNGDWGKIWDNQLYRV
jgi:hypothetical protein